MSVFTASTPILADSSLFAECYLVCENRPFLPQAPCDKGSYIATGHRGAQLTASGRRACPVTGQLRLQPMTCLDSGNAVLRGGVPLRRVTISSSTHLAEAPGPGWVWRAARRFGESRLCSTRLGRCHDLVTCLTHPPPHPVCGQRQVDLDCSQDFDESNSWTGLIDLIVKSESDYLTPVIQ
jgi:hypothetical protein